MGLFKKIRQGISNSTGGELNAQDLFLKGKEIEEQDRAKAFPYFLRAAEMGSPQAMNKVGCCYLYQGRGAEFDLQKSVDWFSKGADVGEPGCMMFLSQFYTSGVGVPQDDDVAKYWLGRASGSGNEKIAAIAQKRLIEFEAIKVSVTAVMETAARLGGIPS